jgi:hypothetical protein
MPALDRYHNTVPATTFVDGLLGMDFLAPMQAVIYAKEGEIRIR